MSTALSIFANPVGPRYGAVATAVEEAKHSARQGRMAEAAANLKLADRLANAHVQELKRRWSDTSRRGGPVDAIVMEHNGVVSLYKERIQPALQVLATLDPYRAAAGYYPLGGSVVAPPRAGDYLFVPFESITGNGGGVATDNIRFELIPAGTAAATRINMRTPLLSWLRYRVRGFLMVGYRDAAAANDFIGVEDARILGGPTFLASENLIPIETFRLGDSERVGLRYAGEVSGSNRIQLTLGGAGLGLAAATAGNTVVGAWAVIEVLEDEIYGKINNPESRAAFRQASSLEGGYQFPEGTPVASTLEQIQLRVEAADAINSLDAPFVQLTGAVNAVNLVSDNSLTGSADYQVVGIQCSSPVKALNTDMVLLDNIRVGGDAQLPAAEGEQITDSFLGDEAVGVGGGKPVIQGFRHYPKLSRTNRLRCTLRARTQAGVAGMNGARIVVPRVTILCNRLDDDIFGKGVGAPFATALLAAMG